MSAPNSVPDKQSGVYDFFISYKQKDARDFSRALGDALAGQGAEVWLDQEQMRPGDSILAGIENGIGASIDAIVVLSENYFSGWSEQERRNLYSLMVARKVRIIPVWYRLDQDRVQSLAPLFADIVAIEAPSGSDAEAQTAAQDILKKFDPKQRETRLYELFFQAVRKHVDDPDLDLFLAVFSDDVKLLESAIQRGGNVNITDAALWNRHNKIVTTHADVFPTWRKLFLHLSSSGKIGGLTPG